MVQRDDLPEWNERLGRFEVVTRWYIAEWVKGIIFFAALALIVLTLTAVLGPQS